MSFFKKALGVFVELDTQDASAPAPSSSRPSAPLSTPSSFAPLDAASAEKFEKHFSDLFDKANLPGPDYFEFWKTMETLEKLIPDESSRLAATFATLSVQGLTKAKLLDTAGAYMEVIARDRAAFEQAAAQKASAAVDGRTGRPDLPGGPHVEPRVPPPGHRADHDGVRRAVLHRGLGERNLRRGIRAVAVATAGRGGTVSGGR